MVSVDVKQHFNQHGQRGGWGRARPVSRETETDTQLNRQTGFGGRERESRVDRDRENGPVERDKQRRIDRARAKSRETESRTDTDKQAARQAQRREKNRGTKRMAQGWMEHMTCQSTRS